MAAPVRAAVAAGVDWVQLRDRTLSAAALLALAEALAAAVREGAAARGGRATLLVNRRVDVALAAGAGGVHLGFDACTPAEARRVWAAAGGAVPWVGVASHAPEEVAAARAAGADYAHLAPIHDPLSKARQRPALGAAALARASELLGPRAGFRLLAQGGMDETRAAEAVRAGADGVAVTGALLGATHEGLAASGAAPRTALADRVADAAARLRATLDRAASGGR